MNNICIFCRQDASTSRSREHIIPESLGNIEHTLKPGIVCDKCNNYFSRKVERKVLNSDRFMIDRFHMSILSKKGRIPKLPGLFIGDGFAHGLPIISSKDRYDYISFKPIGKEKISFNTDKKGKFILPAPGAYHVVDYRGKISTDIPMSRFLAKIALESLMSKLQEKDSEVKRIPYDEQFDALRNFARYGKSNKPWPFYERRIYPMNSNHMDTDGQRHEMLHEYDFLITDNSEWFHIVVIFGIEYTINMGENEIHGYIDWLKEHNGSSPLYQT